MDETEEHAAVLHLFLDVVMSSCQTDLQQHEAAE